MGLILNEEVADIRDTIEGNPIRDATLGRCHLETIGMANDPVGHETTIGAPSNTQSILIDVWISGQHFISQVHQIIVINRTIASKDVRVGIINAIRAMWDW